MSEYITDNNIRIIVKDKDSNLGVLDPSKDIVSQLSEMLMTDSSDEFAYLDSQVRLLNRLIEYYNQSEVVSNSEKYKPTTKLIRLVKPIPRYLLELNGYTPVVIDGYYVAAEGLLIAPELGKILYHKLHKSKSVFYPEAYNLPADYAYGTYNYYGNLGFVLKKSYLTEYLYTGSHWRYLRV